jgi:hypothetical protein
MSWVADRARSMSRRNRVLAIFAIATVCGTLLTIPGSVGALAFSHSSGNTGPRQLPTASPSSRSPGGSAAVGALFTVTAGQPDTHICTASVVHSTHGDLAVTAAHCLDGIQGQVAFAPGYANGKYPYGTWRVTAVYADQAWQSSQNPDDDVAFVKLARTSAGVAIEHVTGAEQLGIGWQEPALVHVTGYPDDTEQPISCTNWTKVFSSTQLEFDCADFTDGTSGSALLANVSASGYGTVVGVIGGYEQGGDTPDVSYAPSFGATVAALYRTAVAAG